jgi:hypothetical protein
VEGGGEVREGRGGGEGELIGYSIEQKKKKRLYRKISLLAPGVLFVV